MVRKGREAMLPQVAEAFDELRNDRVLDSATSDEELLVLSEILVYFGGHPEPGDDKIVSTRSAEIIKVLSGGRAAKADEQYRAPISKKIREAAEKAISNRVPSSRPQQT